MQINIENLYDKILSDKKLLQRMPEINSIFKDWASLKSDPSKRSEILKISCDILDKLASRVDFLEEYFGEPVKIEVIDYKTVYHSGANIHDLVFMEKKYKNFCLSRKGEQIYISFWR